MRNVKRQSVPHSSLDYDDTKQFNTVSIWRMIASTSHSYIHVLVQVKKLIVLYIPHIFNGFIVSLYCFLYFLKFPVNFVNRRNFPLLKYTCTEIMIYGRNLLLYKRLVSRNGTHTLWTFNNLKTRALSCSNARRDSCNNFLIWYNWFFEITGTEEAGSRADLLTSTNFSEFYTRVRV